MRGPFQVLFFVIVSVGLGLLACNAKGVASTSSLPEPSPSVAVEEIVLPDRNGTKPIFYEEIDTVAESVGEGKLREAPLSENDIEIRVWAGFGLTSLRGFLLRRQENVWKASAIEGEFKKPRARKYTKADLPQPSTGWDIAWRRLLEHGILTLPNAESIDCTAMIEDGYSYVVEIKKGNQYRTYLYGNPASNFENRCSQADEMLEIANIIMNNYGVHGFRSND